MDLDKVVEQALDATLREYAAVEPPAGAVARWMEGKPARLPRARFWGLGAPAWAGLVAALMILLGALGASWYAQRRELASAKALLAQERSHIVALPAAAAPPLSDRDKQLIQLMEKDPSALATLQEESDDAAPAKTAAKPAKPGAKAAAGKAKGTPH